MAKTKDFVMFNLKIRPDLHAEFKVAASLEGLDMSNMIRQFMIRTVREAKARDAEKFIQALQQEKEDNQTAQPNNVVLIKNPHDPGEIADATGLDFGVVIKILSGDRKGIDPETVELVESATRKKDEKITSISDKLVNGR